MTTLMCHYFGFLLTSYCLAQNPAQPKNTSPLTSPPTSRFQLQHQWHYINFTWPSSRAYSDAVTTRRYIPENNAMAGIKIHADVLYIALPRIRPGTPVTLASMSLRSYHTDPLLTPFPSWEMNVQKNCGTLQNVQSMEIDSSGVMWVLDGNRNNNFTKCPPKLVLLDLNRGGRVLHQYEFPEGLSSVNGGFLNDIVVDESNGAYAYITENSNHDPGLIVYSLAANRAWKFRDSSMFPEVEAADFVVDGLLFSNLVPADGIALGPRPSVPNQERVLFYSALTAYSLYAINTTALRSEEVSKGDGWRRSVQYVGRKQSQSDGLIADNRGNLYYTLLGAYGVGVWNIHEPFHTSRVLDQDQRTFIWPDSFSFDGKGGLCVLANGIHKYVDSSYALEISSEIKFRILRIFTGTVSYLN